MLLTSVLLVITLVHLAYPKILEVLLDIFQLAIGNAKQFLSNSLQLLGF